MAGAAGDLHKVWETRALKRKPSPADAAAILDKIAKQVQPIMRRHRWRVKILSEFCPSNPALLGLNVGGGLEVRLRLRRHGRDWDFIPYDQVLDTMLHELCHNAVAPHNAQFYKLWDELRKECEELVAKGISGTGQGFDTQGRRLGGFRVQPPLPALRQTALAAAEKRRRIGDMMPAGANRVGGDSGIMKALTPVQAAAMAAERRMMDELWCGSVSQVGGEVGESSSGADVEEEGGEPSSGADVGEEGRETAVGDSGKGGRSVKGADVGLGSSSSPITEEDMDAGELWECSMCTLFNKPLSLICEACGTQKVEATRLQLKTWSCRFCTLQNDIKLDKCSACDVWRYSFGPPVSHKGPNIGT